MKHFLLKLNYGVEIGAQMAYMGHFKRTGEEAINKIIMEEISHRLDLGSILRHYGQEPSVFISRLFWIIGKTICITCAFCPLFMLDFVARTMEAFAVINYSYLADLYPDFKSTFISMAKKELEHKEFFKRRRT